MFTERKAIERRMDEIKLEKQEHRQTIKFLNDENERLLQRLREIDDRDGQRIDLDSLTSGLSCAVDKLSDLVPHVPAATVLERAAEKISDHKDAAAVLQNDSPEEEEEKSAAAKEEEQLEKGRGKSKRKKNPQQLVEVVAEICREYRRPMNIRELEAIISERYGWSWSHFNQAIANASRNSATLEKVGRGRYYVKGVVLEDDENTRDTERPRAMV